MNDDVWDTTNRDKETRNTIQKMHLHDPKTSFCESAKIEQKPDRKKLNF
jgi:hypothetical protein